MKCLTRVVAKTVAFAGLLFLGGTAQFAAAQDANPPYLNTNLTPEQRATDLVRRMTLEEKASQMVNTSPAIPRLKVPSYQWWSEALHGVIDQGVTEYPEPIGLGATFDVPAIHTMGVQISIEGRIKHVHSDSFGVNFTNVRIP